MKTPAWSTLLSFSAVSALPNLDPEHYATSPLKALHNLVQSQEWAEHDTQFSSRFHDYTVRQVTTSNHHVFRMSPQIIHEEQLIPVLNGDHLLAYHRDSLETSHSSTPDDHFWDKTPFSLSIDYIKSNILQRPISSLRKRSLNDDTKHRLYYLDTSYDKPLRAAYHITLTENLPLQAHKELIVDAHTGSILRSRPMVMHSAQGEAHVFPTGYQGDSSAVTLEVLPNLQNLSSNAPVAGIRGLYHHTANACRSYICNPNGTSTTSTYQCDVDDVWCFDDPALEARYTTLLVNKPSPQGTSERFTVPGAYLSIDRDWAAEGFKNSTVFFRYTDLPVMGGKVTRDADGTYDSVWSAESLNELDPGDAFSETQIYYTAEQWNAFISSKFTAEFCSLSMQSIGKCTQLKTSVVDLNHTALQGGFDKQFLLATNIQNFVPDAGYIMQLIDMGYGRTVDNPVSLSANDWLTPFDNAFFYNSMDNLDTSRCVNGSCLYSMGLPLVPFMGFGQGVDRDWSLDNCIASHEMMHSVTKTLIPFIPHYVFHPVFGSASDPGSMNEAWSDYWAVVKCGRVDLSSGWISAINRNLNNTNKSCSPNNSDGNLVSTFLTGEIHHDSQVFSGALWQVRTQIFNNDSSGNVTADVAEWDTIVLTCEALASSEETFALQFGRILDLMKTHPNLVLFVDYAIAVFNERDTYCTTRSFHLNQPVTNLRSQMVSLSLPSNTDIGTLNMGVSPIQLVVHRVQQLVTDNTIKAYKIQWQQYATDKFLFGTSSVGYATIPLQCVISYDCPVGYILKSGVITPINSCDNSTLAIRSASVNFGSIYKTSVQGSLSISQDEIAALAKSSKFPDTAYIVLLHSQPVSYSLYNVEILYVKTAIDVIIGIICGVIFFAAMVSVTERYGDRYLSQPSLSIAELALEGETGRNAMYTEDKVVIVDKPSEKVKTVEEDEIEFVSEDSIDAK